MVRLHFWHRTLGVVAALFVIVLSVTGILLSRTEQLQLDQHFVKNTWILNHYQIGTNPIVSYQADDFLVSHAGDNLYLNANLIASGVHALNGAISLERDLVVSTQERLLVFNSEGELVDEITTFTGLPERPLGLTLTDSKQPVLRGQHSNWLGSNDLLDWKPLLDISTSWSQPVTTPESAYRPITQHDRSQQIHWERVMLDLHSGRLFGNAGQWLMELAAIILLLLSATGIWMWSRRL